MTVTAHHDHELEHVDIKAAFFNSKIGEDIFMARNSMIMSNVGSHTSTQGMLFFEHPGWYAFNFFSVFRISQMRYIIEYSY